MLDDLELAHVGVGGERGELQRVDRDAVEHEDVGAAAVHVPDARERAPAGTGLGVVGHDVGELVADERLDVVEEVGDQHASAGRPVGDGLSVVVDVLDEAELPEDVEARVRGALRGPQALGRGVEVERRDAERGLDAASHVRG